MPQASQRCAKHADLREESSEVQCEDHWTCASVAPATFVESICLQNGELIVASGSGHHVIISSLTASKTQQVLGPAANPVRCAAFCHVSTHFALGAGEVVTVFAPVGESCVQQWISQTDILHEGGVDALSWSSHTGAGIIRESRVLWVAGSRLARWCTNALGDWSQTWSRTLAQPANLLATSPDGLLLATAHKGQQMVKVWHARECGTRHDFSYLRQPGAITSLEWRPSQGEHLQLGYNHPAILLTLCEDGIARLWRASTPMEADGACRVFLCGTLAWCDDARATPSAAMPCHLHAEGLRLQSIHWIRPSPCPCVPRAFLSSSRDAEMSRLDSNLVNLGVRRTSLQSVSSAVCAPTLHSFLRDRHDYVIGQLADGTLIVWLLLSLSADPRCAPKIMVWATLPRALPCVPGVTSAVAYCQFQPSLQSPSCSTPKHKQEEDRLPSTLLLLQHTMATECPLRLCTVNVERGTAENRVQQLCIRGHAADITALHPHPACSLAASLSVTGELLVWESAALSCGELAHDQRRMVHSSKRLDSASVNAMQSNEAPAPHCEASSSCGNTSALPANMLHLPGHFEALTWLDDTLEGRTCILALGSQSAHLFVRAADCCWLHHAKAPVLPQSAHDEQHGRWLGVHVLTQDVASCEAHCISIKASDPHLFVWSVSGDELEGRGSASLAIPGMLSGPCYVEAFQQFMPGIDDHETKSVTSTSKYLGSLLCGYRDGTLAVWQLTADLDNGISCTMNGSPVPTDAGSAVRLQCMSLSRDASPRAALVLRPDAPAQTPGVMLRILEFESNTSTPELEYTLDVSAALGSDILTSSCAIAGIANGTHTLAVASNGSIGIFWQLHARQQHVYPGRPKWALLKRVFIPHGLPSPMQAVWTNSGSLIASAGPLIFTWDDLLSSCGQFSANLPYWHPEVLRHQLLADPKLAEPVLHFLLNCDSGQNQLPLSDILQLEVRSKEATDTHAALGAGVSREDAPSASILDIFAPGPSTWQDVGAGRVSGTICATQVESMAGRLLRRMDSMCEDQVFPGLCQSEQEDLKGLLRVQQTIDGLNGAVDDAGGRFLLLALDKSLQPWSQGMIAGPAIAWAMLSDCHSTLLDVATAAPCSPPDWPALRALGVGYWLPFGDTLRNALDAAAKVQFAKQKNPEDCALLYIALGKQHQLHALCKATRNEKLALFLANDFSTPRWRSAAVKNAYSLLAKQQFELAVAFFLLGADLDAAINVCSRQLCDLQLALVLCRLQSTAAPNALCHAVREELLPYATSRSDSWLRCIAFVLLAQPGEAIDALTSTAGYAAYGLAGACAPLNETCVGMFCTHIMASRRWRSSLSMPNHSVFIRSASFLAREGCLLLAMQALQRQTACVGNAAIDQCRVAADKYMSCYAHQFLASRAAELLCYVPSLSMCTSVPAVVAAIHKVARERSVSCRS